MPDRRTPSIFCHNSIPGKRLDKWPPAPPSLGDMILPRLAAVSDALRHDTGTGGRAEAEDKTHLVPDLALPWILLKPYAIVASYRDR